MKKSLSIVLALVMIFSFAALFGCSDNPGDNPSDSPSVNPSDSPSDSPSDNSNAETEITEEMLRNSKPNEYVPEKLAAGIEVIVAFNPITLEGIGAPQDVRLAEEMPKLGFTYLCACWDRDTAVQIQQIENFITMGAAAVAIHTTDPEGVADVTAVAEAAGTSIIFYGTEPSYFCSGITSVNMDQIGYSSALIVRAWLDEAYPDAGEGTIQVAALGSYVVTDVVVLSDAIRRGITDDPRCTIVYTHDLCTGIDKGFTSAEEAFTANPDIKVVASYDLQAAFGASNYIMTLPGVNPDDYCVVGTTSNSDVQGFIQQAKDGQGVFRGTTTGDDDPAAGFIECISGILLRGEDKPYVFFEQLHTETSFDFDYERYYAEYYSEA